MSFNFFHVRLPWQPKLPYNFHKNFMYVIRTLSLIFLWKISFLAQKVHVSEILRHFSQLYPTQSRLVYDPTEMILAILYSEVPYMLPAKYPPNPLGGSGEEVIWMVFTIYGHGGHLEFQIRTHFSLILYIYHICAKYEISLKLASHFHRKCHLIFFHVRLPWQPKLSCNFHKIFIYVIKTLSLIFLWKISFLG